MFLELIIFIISLLVLVKSGGVVVKHLVRIARFLKWSEFIVSFLIMAVVTSLPELFVGITSAIHKRPELSFGNVIGSNIINLTLIVAIPVLVVGALTLKSKMAQRTGLYTAAIAVLPVLLVIDGMLSRIDGIMLLICLVLYFNWILRKKEQFKKAFNNTNIKEDPNEIPIGTKTFLKDSVFFLIGMAFLLLAGEGIVYSAVSLAGSLGVPLVIISIILVALGTNLPELIFSIKAVKLKHKDMVLGNLMGSVIVNSTLVLGLTVLIHPLKIVNYSPYIAGIIFTLITIFLFVLFVRTHEQINRKEALFLLLVYFLFVIIQFIVK